MTGSDDLPFEMPSVWKNLIMTSLDEGNVETGLETWESFLSPAYTPPGSLLLILFHIVLSSSASTNGPSANASSSSDTDFMQANKATSFSRRPQQAPAASRALRKHAPRSLALLYTLIGIHPARALARALPPPPPDDHEDPNRRPHREDESELAELERAARGLLRWRDFWEGGLEEEQVPGAADGWWSLLRWAIEVWERDLDEVEALELSQPPTDEGIPTTRLPIFLTQLPRPRASEDPRKPRTDLSRPLALIFAAYSRDPSLVRLIEKEKNDADGLYEDEEETLSLSVEVPATGEEEARWEERRRSVARLMSILIRLATPKEPSQLFPLDSPSKRRRGYPSPLVELTSLVAETYPHLQNLPPASLLAFVSSLPESTPSGPLNALLLATITSFPSKQYPTLQAVSQDVFASAPPRASSSPSKLKPTPLRRALLVVLLARRLGVGVNDGKGAGASSEKGSPGMQLRRWLRRFRNGREGPGWATLEATVRALAEGSGRAKEVICAPEGEMEDDDGENNDDVGVVWW